MSASGRVSASTDARLREHDRALLRDDVREILAEARGPLPLAELVDRLGLLRERYRGWTERRLAAELAEAGAPVGWIEGLARTGP